MLTKAKIKARFKTGQFRLGVLCANEHLICIWLYSDHLFDFVLKFISSSRPTYDSRAHERRYNSELMINIKNMEKEIR